MSACAQSQRIEYAVCTHTGASYARLTFNWITTHLHTTARCACAVGRAPVHVQLAARTFTRNVQKSRALARRDAHTPAFSTTHVRSDVDGILCVCECELLRVLFACVYAGTRVHNVCKYMYMETYARGRHAHANELSACAPAVACDSK